MNAQEQILVADRTVKIKDLLENLGYEVWRTPLQVPCPVHKLGQETRPSARIYTDDDHSLWCFYCARQYWPTEIWEAQKSITRETAAHDLLTLWPVSPERAQAILRTATVPVVAPVEAVYIDLLERHLGVFRGKARYESYRKWAHALDQFSIYLGGLQREMQEIGVRSFVDRMDQELSESCTPGSISSS